MYLQNISKIYYLFLYLYTIHQNLHVNIFNFVSCHFLLEMLNFKKKAKGLKNHNILIDLINEELNYIVGTGPFTYNNETYTDPRLNPYRLMVVSSSCNTWNEGTEKWRSDSCLVTKFQFSASFKMRT